MKENLKSLILKNTITNYIRLGCSLISTLFITRFIYLGLSRGEYGFWALLWSIFGYSLLLEFGFGFSLQKYTAELDATKDTKKYNHLLNTVMVSYLGASAIIVILTLIGTQFLHLLFRFPEGTDFGYYKKTFLIFGIGSALLFPTGAFSEILTGLKKIYLRNIISIMRIFTNLLGVSILFHLGYGLMELAVFTLILTFINNILFAIVAFRHIPGVRLNPLLFRKSLLKEVVSFSFFIYLIQFSKTILLKTDQIVLGVMLGVGSVAIYQIGIKLTHLVGSLSTQFQANLPPIAASLHKKGETEKLRKILTDSNRFIAFLSTLLFVVVTILAEPILVLWLEEIDPMSVKITYILNTSLYILLLFRSGNKGVLLMTGSHKYLSLVGFAESILNLVISIILIKLYGIIGVALGTLIPCSVLNIFFVFPKACKFSQSTVTEQLKEIYLPVFLCAIPCAIFLISLKILIPIQSWNIPILISGSGIAALIYIGLCYLFVLKEEDIIRIRKFFPRPKKELA